jgi:hypothetical protein
MFCVRDTGPIYLVTLTNASTAFHFSRQIYFCLNSSLIYYAHYVTENYYYTSFAVLHTCRRAANGSALPVCPSVHMCTYVKLSLLGWICLVIYLPFAQIQSRMDNRNCSMDSSNRGVIARMARMRIKQSTFLYSANQLYL